MVTYSEAKMTQLSIHNAGNKLLDEKLVLSEHPAQIDDDILDNLLKQYFLSPFEKSK